MWDVASGADRQLDITFISDCKDLILVHTVQLKPMIKAYFSGRMVSSGISDVAFASVHSDKTRLKKLIMIYYFTCKTKTIY